MKISFALLLSVAAGASSALASDTFLVVSKIPGSSLLVDASGDGNISDMDIALQVHAKMSGLVITDLTGDGVTDHYDMMHAINVFVTSTMGDIDKDGKVDEFDLGAFMDVAASALDEALKKDVNGDGEVTAGDAAALIDKVFSSTGEDGLSLTSSALDMLFSDMGTVQTHGAAAFAGVQLVSSDHVKIISKDWYENEPKHSKWYSRQWPSNHRKTITTDWQEHSFAMSHSIWPHAMGSSSLANPGHYVLTSADHMHWPENHRRLVSIGWKEPLSEPDHSVYNSNAPTHNEAHSRMWEHVPNHRKAQSLSWGPDHATDVSIGWPTNHKKASSQQHIVPAHDTTTSASWDELGHTQALSAVRYPPNHDSHVSVTWTTHNVLLSSNWPPNHHQHVSATWAPTEWRFPANHVKATSEEDFGPYSPPPLRIWPEGHTVFSSFKDIRDLIPIPTP